MTLAQYFRLVDVQAKMALKAESSRFLLGSLWWFLEPLLWVAVFYVVFNLILDSGARKGIEFLVFLATGKFGFIWFSRTVMQASNSIFANMSLVGKIHVPKTLFPMVEIQQGLYRQSAVYCFLFIIILSLGYSVTWTWLWLLPLFFVYYLMIVACSLVGAYLVCIVRDFSKLIPLVMTFLLFVSGIFWDVRAIPDVRKAELVLALNPLAFILDAHRQILLYETPPALLHMVAIGAVSVVLIVAMVLLMRRRSQYLALKVLT